MKHLRLRDLMVLACLFVTFTTQAYSPNALIRLAVASLRSAASHSSELETQALMGTPVALGEEKGEWVKALLPDGYEAFVHRTAVQPVDSAAMAAWRRSPRLICTALDETKIYSEADDKSLPVSDFSLGCIVEGTKDYGGEFTAVTLPDGRRGWVRSSAVAPFEMWMSRPVDNQRVMAIARALNGSAYLWGGRSVKGVDCSGLTQLAYFDRGIILPRNASAQALCGEPVNGFFEQGDLLFFKNDEGRVNHVAIYDTDDYYIHSSGLVHRSSLNPNDLLYNGRTVHFGRRVEGEKRVADHPWYFTQKDVANSLNLSPPVKQIRFTGGNVKAVFTLAESARNIPVAGHLPQDFNSTIVSVNYDDSIPNSYDFELPGFPCEAYSIKIDNEGCKITAVTEIGAVRAMQTLLQLTEGRDSIPALEITDWPAFKIRGYMHDVGRSYIPVDDLVKHIELLSRFKVNVFHWHLTENQAWRLEIASHPELTSPESMTRLPGKFYTATDVKRVMDAAHRNGVTVIPEIDMPGHSEAFQRATGHDMQSEEGMAILRDVLDEVAVLFADAPYIHIGADEKEIHNPDFLRSMTDYVHSLGKRVICWNPIHGVKIAKDQGFDMTQMWSTAGKAVAGLPNIDCRYNYTNHFDVFADLVGIYKSNIYYKERGDAETAGTISAAWNDRQLPTSEDITIQNNFYANVLASAERAWKGGGKQYIEQGGVTLPVDGDEFEEFADFERRFLYHKEHLLKDEKIPYMRQTNINWLITDNSGNRVATKGAGVYLRHTWGSIVPALFTTPELGESARAETFIYSPVEQEVGAVIELQNYSRSERDLAPDNGCWDRKGSKVWLNGEELLPQPWDNAGKEIDNEALLLNENFPARKPLKVKLRQGWNHVCLYLPYAPAPGVRLNKWMFTFLLTDPAGRNALEGITYSPELY